LSKAMSGASPGWGQADGQSSTMRCNCSPAVTSRNSNPMRAVITPLDSVDPVP